MSDLCSTAARSRRQRREPRLPVASSQRFRWSTDEGCDTGSANYKARLNLRPAWLLRANLRGAARKGNEAAPAVVFASDHSSRHSNGTGLALCERQERANVVAQRLDPFVHRLDRDAGLEEISGDLQRRE